MNSFQCYKCESVDDGEKRNEDCINGTSKVSNDTCGKNQDGKEQKYCFKIVGTGGKWEKWD